MEKESKINENNPENLQEKCQNLEEENRELKAKIKWYQEQFRLAKEKQFGRSSEKTEGYGDQLGFFDEAENEADHKVAEPAMEEITYSRKKRVGKREEDLSSLPVETIEYDLPEEEKACSQCGEPMHVMSKETRRELKIIPAQVSVVEHVRYIYSCRDCEKNATEVQVKKAKMPNPVIPNSVASPSTIAYIMTQKYGMASPLYRLEQDFKTQGIPINRQNMANWIVKSAENWLSHIYEAMRQKLLKRDVLHADETPVQVIRQTVKKANSNAYMWLYRSSWGEKPVVLYEYQPTRSSSNPKRFLVGFKGYLHTDGYSGYHNLSPDINVVGCWAHLRRKFDEALKAVAPEDRAGSMALEGLEYCNRLFHLEKEMAEISPQERYAQRLEKSKPLADAFYDWLNSLQVLPKSGFGKAVHYAREQRHYLMNVYLNGRLELSNNRAERSIKSFVIGRKNWLFCYSKDGAQASSIVYSIIETAKENGLNPMGYLTYLLGQLPNTNFEANPNLLDDLMPWSQKLPDSCLPITRQNRD
jgi:transposase